jgi:hypothetical protein
MPISLFNSRREVLESIDQTIKATKNDRTLRAILIIVEDPNGFELSGNKLIHLIDVSPRLVSHNITGIESGNSCYLFLGLRYSNEIWLLLGSAESRSSGKNHVVNPFAKTFFPGIGEFVARDQLV